MGKSSEVGEAELRPRWLVTAELTRNESARKNGLRDELPFDECTGHHGWGRRSRREVMRERRGESEGG
eukprot:391992-Pleurochrysis_carterae.AAC.1